MTGRSDPDERQAADHDGEVPRSRRNFQSRISGALAAFLVIAAFYLVTEHRAHLFGALPYFLLAAAVLLAILMYLWFGGIRRRDHRSRSDKLAEDNMGRLRDRADDSGRGGGDVPPGGVS